MTTQTLAARIHKHANDLPKKLNEIKFIRSSERTVRRAIDRYLDNLLDFEHHLIFHNALANRLLEVYKKKKELKPKHHVALIQEVVDFCHRYAHLIIHMEHFKDTDSNNTSMALYLPVYIGATDLISTKENGTDRTTRTVFLYKILIQIDADDFRVDISPARICITAHALFRMVMRGTCDNFVDLDSLLTDVIYSSRLACRLLNKNETPIRANTEDKSFYVSIPQGLLICGDTSSNMFYVSNKRVKRQPYMYDSRQHTEPDDKEIRTPVVSIITFIDKDGFTPHQKSMYDMVSENALKDVPDCTSDLHFWW